MAEIFILNRPGIEEFFMPIGSVDRYLEYEATRIKNLATRTAPARTGHLKNAHGVERAREATGRYVSGYRVTNRAAYAYVVHEGTSGFGHPPGARTIRPKFPLSKTSPNRPAALGPLAPWGGHTQAYHNSVSGQHDNPWLSDAMAKVMLGL